MEKVENLDGFNMFRKNKKLYFITFTIETFNGNLLQNKLRQSVIRPANQIIWNLGIAFPVAKNAPFKYAIDRGLTRMKENGFPNYWKKYFTALYKRQYSKSITEKDLVQSDEIEKRITTEPFSLGQLQGPFFMVITGNVLAVAIFIIEKYLKI